ncbi:NAD-dependent epimerase/dehydratase family protein [Parvularcula sp. ZS-1/3]|uniref:NAD-dependent epimerase/dehydratase family protein n=1 Tax=Parvularcula mediterranea TaxID=2732508 RepID=A0A7Y3RLU3_9PROT|nr:NAD-dependent epimerase/dehydratase family protein [Parvularcula mediterranea]NNU16471.1 NAD-dependent epimerase/dehydratase family protein [Parvularcula mediterranea]
MTLLITGAAGFIGFHTARALMARGERIVGVDNLNSYYDRRLKETRLDLLKADERFTFIGADIGEDGFAETLKDKGIDRIIHLAAQAGVRYSIEAPRAYTASNLAGQTEILELARAIGAKHTVYASSSSVYGRNAEVPFSEEHRTDHPVSFYGATKKSCEVMSESYASLYALPLTGLRFFTVYGPYGRPDMAYMIFARKIMAGESIDVFGEGEMARDFTFIDDCVAGIIGALDNAPTGDVPHEVYNLGNDSPETLGDFIATLERHLGKQAKRNLMPMQPGDVRRTWANIDKARAKLGYDPKTSLGEGLASFVDWYKEYTAN